MKKQGLAKSIVIPRELFLDRKISAKAKLLYGLIGYWQTMSGGICYATNAELAADLCDCTPDHASRLIRELRNAGYVESTHSEGRGREIWIIK